MYNDHLCHDIQGPKKFNVFSGKQPLLLLWGRGMGGTLVDQKV